MHGMAGRPQGRNNLCAHVRKLPGLRVIDDENVFHGDF
jgi:hypothetical protein